MRMEALRQTNYVKSIVTAQGKMDLERKGKQSYQGWMCARLLAFSNGDLQALFDRSDGFYRKTGGIDFRSGRRYVCTQRLTLLPHILEALHADKVVVPILGTTRTM